MQADNQELKELYKSTFNAVSDGYGHSAMRFFPESAKQISQYLNLKGDEQVLDVATGTGYVALTIAKELPDGHVTGIDFSSGMLTQAMKNRDRQEICNVTFVEMDMQEIDYQDRYFDVAISAFSIFFVEDMKTQLSHIADKVKTGGKILITTFLENAFTPLVDLFLKRLESYGVEVPSLAWKRVASQQQCLSLFDAAGLRNATSRQLDLGYYLADAAEWWSIIWNAGFRGLVNQLSQSDLIKFKAEHLAEIDALMSEKGLWLEMNILYTIGESRG
ncbi:MAG: class I SAM-dependent methyltransferase [Candidatus Thiodiazotropha sp.]